MFEVLLSGNSEKKVDGDDIVHRDGIVYLNAKTGVFDGTWKDNGTNQTNYNNLIGKHLYSDDGAMVIRGDIKNAYIPDKIINGKVKEIETKFTFRNYPVGSRLGVLLGSVGTGFVRQMNLEFTLNGNLRLFLIDNNGVRLDRTISVFKFQFNQTYVLNVKLASGAINVTVDGVNIFSQAVNNEYLLFNEPLYIGRDERVTYPFCGDIHYIVLN